MARNWINSAPQAAATTFAFSSVFILLTRVCLNVWDLELEPTKIVLAPQRFLQEFEQLGSLCTVQLSFLSCSLYHRWVSILSFHNNYHSPSPVPLSSSLTLLSTVCRAFRKEDEFKKRFNVLLNAHMSADSLFRLSTRYLVLWVLFQTAFVCRLSTRHLVLWVLVQTASSGSPPGI